MKHDYDKQIRRKRDRETERMKARAELAESMLSNQSGPDLDAHLVLIDTEAKLKRFAEALAIVEYKDR